MSASDIKTVQIIGGADMGHIKKPRRSTKRNRNIDNDIESSTSQKGGNASDITASNLRGVSANIMLVRGTEPSNTSVAATAASINPAKWLNGPIPAPPSIIPAPSYVPTNPNQSGGKNGGDNTLKMEGGVSTDRQIKVELRKSKTPKKVHLNPKKQDAPRQELHKKHKTRKVRKVTLGVSALHKRMTRAKKLREKVKGVPIQELKEQLVKKGLVKAHSKAPESVLRQIAIDSQIVAGKAL